MTTIADAAKQLIQVVNDHIDSATRFLEAYSCECPVCTHQTDVVNRRISDAKRMKEIVEQLANKDNGKNDPGNLVPFESVYSAILVFESDLVVFAKNAEQADVAYGLILEAIRNSVIVLTKDLMGEHGAEIEDIIKKIQIRHMASCNINIKPPNNKNGPN